MVDAGTSSSDLHLAQILPGHRSDVKCIATTAQGMVTVGRGGNLIIWDRSDPHTLVMKHTLAAGAGCAANSVAVFTGQDGNDFVFVGLSAGVISCFSSASGDEVAKLSGHKSNVSTLYVDQAAKLLISGSWDGTAVVWDLSEMYEGVGANCEKIVLRGHEQSVWAVKVCPNQPDHFLTGSADKTVKLWNKEQLVKTIQTKDIVRAIEIVSRTRIFVLHNTGPISFWDLESGACLATYTGVSGEFMYSMRVFTSTANEKCLVTCGEGGNVDVWKRSDDDQLVPGLSLTVPAASLWSVAVLGNGDIAIGASDSSTYVFTYDEGHQADEQALQSFQAAMESREAEDRARRLKESSQEVVTIKVDMEEGKPPLDLKYRKGSDPALAAQEFIIENNVPQHFLQEIIDFIKRSVPEANNPTGPKRQKQSVNIAGQVYDFALEVSLGPGKDVKLGYNVGEDYDVAAQRFCNQNSIPKAMVPKLSQMLRNQFPDVGPSTAEVGDPLTGAKRYIPDGQGTSAEAHNPLKPRTDQYPLERPTYFELLPKFIEKACDKLLEYNNLQDSNLKLTDEEVKAFVMVFSGQEVLSPSHLISGLQKGLSWPLNTLLPVVDVLRLSVGREDVNSHFFAKQRAQETLNKLRAILLSSEEGGVTLTVCRALCNVFKQPQGCEAMKSDINNWLQIFINEVMVKMPKAQAAVSKVIGNFAYQLGMSNGKVVEVGPREDALVAIIVATKRTIEENPLSFRLDREAAVHLLKSLITLLWGDRELVKMGKDNGIADLVSHFQDSIPDEDGKSIAREITVMIHSL